MLFCKHSIYVYFYWFGGNKHDINKKTKKIDLFKHKCKRKKFLIRKQSFLNGNTFL